MRNHIIYQPDAATRRARDRVRINSALLSGQGAEMAFSRGVLLVEGEADKLFFETLRRRIAPYDDSGMIDELAIVWVGSNASFAPWIRLLESYATDGVRPIEWLLVADGADSAPAVTRALRDAAISLSPSVSRALSRVATAAGAGDEALANRYIGQFNEAARRTGVRAALLPVDLEYTALSTATRATVRRIARRLGTTAQSRDDLLRRLGSKHGAGPVARPIKAPWTRAVIAEELRLRGLSGDAVAVLRRWFQLAMGSARRANSVLRAAGVSIQ